jgi:ABC-type transport system involved in multi-copper enzyme maturation permease subunit
MNRLKSPNFILFTILFVFLLLAIVATISSNYPDGLENVLQRFHGNQESDINVTAPFSQYVIHPEFDPWLNQSLSALVGMGIILMIFLLIKRVVFMKPKREYPNDAT